MITWHRGEPITAEKLNRVTADLYRRQRMRVSGAATYTEGPNGKTLHVIPDSEGREYRLDGDPTSSQGVDFDLDSATKIYCDIYHLQNFLSGNSGTVVQNITASKKYWVEIDLANTTSLASAAQLKVGDSFPGTTTDLLVYKLAEVNGDADRALLYRGCWLWNNGSDTHLRFSDVVTPDVPLGTVRMWDDTANVPIGWEEYSRMVGYFPVGYDSTDSDYDALGNGSNTNSLTGHKWHGDTENNHNDHALGHTHDSEFDLVTGSGAISALIDVGDVYEWTGGDNLPSYKEPTGTGSDSMAEHFGGYNSNKDTDNRPPYSPVMFIKRVAV